MTTQELLQQLTPEELEIVETVARCSSMTVDQFTVQQINHMLAQARQIGDLAERTIH
jgi:hypothetical protein